MTKQNKETTRLIWATVTAAFALVLFVAGCTTTGYKRSDAAAFGMQQAAEEVHAEKNALEFTTAALKTLFEEPGADLRQPFLQYRASVDRLVAAARKTEATGAKMAQRHRAYLATWDKNMETIDFEHIRELSETRKGEVTERFELVNRRYQESQEAVQPLISYLKDIETALDSDLTNAGVASLRGVAENATTNAAKLQTALTALMEELTVSGARLSSLTAQEPRAAAQQ